MSEPKRQRTAVQVVAALHSFIDYGVEDTYPERLQEDTDALENVYGQQGYVDEGRRYAMIAYLESVDLAPGGWTYTQDRLPEKPGEYLCVHHDRIELVKWTGEAWSNAFFDRMADVLAWRELPPLPPPREEE